jgi:hypothetical protein
MAHKGIRQYTAEESGALAIGQAGFDVITSGSLEGTFVAIQVIGAVQSDGADYSGTNTQSDNYTAGWITVAAECNQGDDLPATDVTSGTTIYGAFSKITVTNNTNGAKILAHRG